MLKWFSRQESSVVLVGFSLFQLTDSICLCLLTFLGSIGPEEGSLKNIEIWLYFFQIPLSILAIYSQKFAHDRRKKVLLVYVVGTMLLGLLASVAFMVFCNNYEIDNKLCHRWTLFSEGASTTSAESSQCISSLAGRTWQIWRTAFFVVVEAMAVHPAVSLLAEQWKEQVEDKEDKED